MKIIHLKIASDIYSVFTRNDIAYANLTRKGIIDLGKDDHCKQVLIFLRSWRCRQFIKEYTEQSINSIQEWYKIYKNDLPNEKDNILNYHFHRIDEYFNDLSERIASERKGNNVRIGPVGAAKLLFAFRPNTFIPWDNYIINKLSKNNNKISYYSFIKYHVKGELKDLTVECKKYNINIKNLPETINKKFSTLPKLIDEYLWMTITNNFQPDDIIETIKSSKYL